MIDQAASAFETNKEEEDPPSQNIVPFESPSLAGEDGVFSVFNKLPDNVHFIFKKSKHNPFPENPVSKNFHHHYFPDATQEQWNSWRWQIRNSFTSLGQLAAFLNLIPDELGSVQDAKNTLPLRITPYYASLLAMADGSLGLRKSVVPQVFEYQIAPEEALDPLDEEKTSPLPNLVHRYPDRVLFLATSFCSVYCRYCTRTHMVGKKNRNEMSKLHWDNAIAYISQHPEVRDVLISGGDPLTLSDEHLHYLLSRLRAIPHLEIIRIGTKVPAVLPQRITRSLVNILKKNHPLYLSLHFTHPDEITIESKEACDRLANAGIPLGSQTVLLKGINDEVGVMRKLMQKLLVVRVRPYYLYQCDPIPGSGHMRTTVQKGLDIIQGLRGHTSGYAVPHYVIDAPGGGGKIPLLPDYYQGHDGKDVVLKNYQGNFFKYPDML